MLEPTTALERGRPGRAKARRRSTTGPPRLARFLLGWILGQNAGWAGTPFPPDPQSHLERTCFQTGQGWSEPGNLRSDVAIVYGIDPGLPGRVQTWRDRGYRIHVMTGVSWGNYQDYLYGRFDGTNHEDEAQTDRSGKKISHGGDVYYMCPGENFGRFLSVGVQRALDAGAEAVHLEEPEFWVRGGYSEGFKREWRKYYLEEWVPPHTSVDAQWRASKLKYFLYRRALQQVFDHVQDWNRRQGRNVRCYVPTHSLLNYAHWRIVSPESSLAQLAGCHGYIAQVWTGTSRTPNLYQGQLKERTFETAFLEYGAMSQIVPDPEQRVWFLNDPIEDDPNHDWEDYRQNWESTLVASLLRGGTRFEVAPWPERVFAGRYPTQAKRNEREPIPPRYATELQTVFDALNDMNHGAHQWDAGTTGIGLLVSDSLMFERGDPTPSDPHLSHVYGLALPLLKHGMPITPVQLEHVGVPGYLAGLRLLLLSYHGQKPLSPDIHAPLAKWVASGGVLVVWDNDADPYNRVREWWNTGTNAYATPREHLFAALGLGRDVQPGVHGIGRGRLFWQSGDPAELARSLEGASRVLSVLREAVRGRALRWRETNYLLVRRGPYLIAAGLDESVPGPAREMEGRFVSLFDPELRVQRRLALTPGSRHFVLDLDQAQRRRPREFANVTKLLPGDAARRGPVVLASAGKALPQPSGKNEARYWVEGVAGTPAVTLLSLRQPPRTVKLGEVPLTDWTWDGDEKLLWIRFRHRSSPRELVVTW